MRTENHISVWRKVRSWAKRLFKLILLAIFAYVAILIVGLIPVNSDFQRSEEGITIYVISNAVHADLVLPKSTSTIDWSQKFLGSKFAEDNKDDSHIAFGWGDRGFFLETETWDDFKLSTAANALLLPSGSCMHVAFTDAAY